MSDLNNDLEALVGDMGMSISDAAPTPEQPAEQPQETPEQPVQEQVQEQALFSLLRTF